ncbi:MAG: DMT family transporter [Acidimicrobiia bacterium]
MVLAVLAAMVAAFLYAISAVYQQEEAAAQPQERALRPSLLVRLIRNPKWLGAFALDWSGYVAEAIALGLATIVIVIPLLQSGLLFALFIEARRTHERLHRPDWIAAVVLCVGLTGFLVTANPSGGIDRPSFAAWLPWLIGLGSAAVVCAIIGRLSGSTVRAVAWGLAAGCLFGMTGPLTKTIVTLLSDGALLTILKSWELYALIAFSIVGMLFNQSAFQAGNLPASLPAMSVAIPVFASAIGLWVYQEDVAIANWVDAAIVTAFGCAMIIGVWILARREALRPGRLQPTTPTP